MAMITNNLTMSNKSYLDTWQLEKRVNGLEIAVDGVRDTIAPILNEALYDDKYVSNICSSLDRIEILEKAFEEIKTNIDTMSQSMEEMASALKKYTTPAGNNQDNRTSKPIGDLEFFPPNYYDFDILMEKGNIWIYPKVEEKPIKIVYEDNYPWCETLTNYLVNELDDNDEKYKPLLDLGINVKDSNNQFRSTYDILQELSEKWSNLQYRFEYE